MIKIKVKAKKRWSSSDRFLVQLAADFASSELGLWSSPVPIQVKLKGKLAGGDLGYAVDLDDRICISLAKTNTWLSTLFHELEHARQYMDDELELEEDTAVWKEKKYSRKPEKYLREPWEVQARKVEKKLLKQFHEIILDS